MQKDFEEEQEKNRKKEEEVMRIFSYFKWNLSESCEVLIYGKWIYGHCVPQDTHAAWSVVERLWCTLKESLAAPLSTLNENAK